MGLRRDYKAFNTALRSLYGRELLTLADEDRPFDFDDALFDEVAKTVYKNGGFDVSCLTEPQARALMNETLRVLDTAIGSALPHKVPDTIRYALENNAFVFSGFKTFHALREVGLSMLTEKGEIKPFGDFLTDVRRINAQYNHNYLYAEYNHALGATQMAAKWHDFERDGDRYNLQYRTAGDDKVREEHAILNGTTLPPSDPFWDMFLPPNGWNCRCTVVQVRKNKYPESDPELAMQNGQNCTDGAKKAVFRYNAGKSLQLFPPKHPYFKAPPEAKQVIEQVTQEAIREKRIRDMVEELPDNLTPDEKQAIAEHNLNIEAQFGITKEAAMDYDKANKGKENPNFTKGGGYYVNCQTCTVTHWLRRLGFNIEAKPNIKDNAFKELKAQGITWQQRFTNLDGSNVDYDLTYKWQKRKGYSVMTEKRLNEYLSEKFNHDGVYEIYCGWKRGNAHVFCAEVTNGKVRYFDPQSGEDDVKNYLPRMKFSMVGVLRIDNKLVNPKLKNLFIHK